VKTVCTAGAEDLSNVQPNLGNWFGAGSIFAFDGSPHRDRRRLLAPAFHGQNLRHYEQVIEAETLRESANWPEGAHFRILEPMNRITLNVIIRTIFGAKGTELDELREIVPPYMKRGQVLAFATPPPHWARRHSPWGKLDEIRASFDRIVCSLISEAEADPNLAQRTDILASLVRSRNDQATAMSRQDICDELSTLVGAGHETTASALAWTFERLRRHPEVLAELVREVDEGGRDFRRATIWESLRVRTVIDVCGRRVTSPHFTLDEWRISPNRNVIVRIADLHEDPLLFPDPTQFNPHRFSGSRPAAPTWLAFGGGARRCIGADFAVTEMDIVLRTVLRNFRIQTDAAADEESCFRGIAHSPKHGGRVALNRRA
jgi:cytochrome P450 family 138